VSGRSDWATTPPGASPALAPNARRWSAQHAHLADLAAVRTFVAGASAEAGLDDAARDALVLATDEVCANVIVHGYGGRAPGPLEVVVCNASDGVHVTVADTGAPFDPADAPAAELHDDWAERPVGGLGWHLVRHLVDDLSYERRGDANRVTLVKRRAAI